jgi:hypothetical protein
MTEEKNKYSEEDIRQSISNLTLVDPAHLTLSSDGHGEFPDSYKLTKRGVEYIIEQFKKK